MNDRRLLAIPPLGIREQRYFQKAVHSLEAVPVGGPASTVFKALRALVPVAGGMVGVMGSEINGSAVSHLVDLPYEVFEGWARTPLEHLHRMMAPLVGASPGDVISDQMALQGSLREQIDLLRVLDAAGLGESAGYKIAARKSIFGRPEHHFLTVALERGESFSLRRRQLLRLLQRDVRKALARMAVPLTASEPILTQIIGEGRIGYICVSASRSIVETNGRAHELVARYLERAAIEPGRGYFQRFVERVLSETAGGRAWLIFRPDVATALNITSHALVKKAQPVARDLTLIKIDEIEMSPGEVKVVPPQSVPPAKVKLTRRQGEIAHLWVSTAHSQKEIASRLRIAKSTVKNHIDAIYRAQGVNGRIELMRKLGY